MVKRCELHKISFVEYKETWICVECRAIERFEELKELREQEINRRRSNLESYIQQTYYSNAFIWKSIGWFIPFGFVVWMSGNIIYFSITGPNSETPLIPQLVIISLAISIYLVFIGIRRAEKIKEIQNEDIPEYLPVPPSIEEIKYTIIQEIESYRKQLFQRQIYQKNIDRINERLAEREKTKIQHTNENLTKERQIPSPKKFSLSSTLRKIDKMDGYEFEAYTANLLRKIGYNNVTVTRKSGDNGVDIFGEDTNGLKTAFQCKRFAETNTVANIVIQQIFAAKAMYKCQNAVVITTSSFTKPAKEVAHTLGVELWDREVLKEKIMQAEQFTTNI